MLKIYFAFVFLFVSIVGSAANSKIEAKNFLFAVRQHRGVDTWAELKGEVVHQRRGVPIKKSPIAFAIRFAATQLFAKILIGKNEGYTIGLFTASDTKRRISIIPMNEKQTNSTSLLKYYGIRPEDLTMSFLYWDLVEELNSVNISMQTCRVFKLKSIEKNEIAIVYISEKYLFPLKVEWLKEQETKPYRTMNVSSFKKVNGLWLIDEITLFGPGWRTKITFNTCNAGTVKEGIPKGLLTIKQE